MKHFQRTFAVFMMIFAVFFALNSLGFAEESTNETTLDLSNMSIKDILEIRSKIEEELYKRGDAVVLPNGEYLVGRDIAAGSYTLTAYSGKENYSGISWSIAIYRGSESKAALAQALQEHLFASIEASGTKEAGKEVIYPVNVYAYKVLEKWCMNTDSVQITLEEGQVLDMVYWFVPDNVEVEVVISKFTGLFMD